MLNNWSELKSKKIILANKLNNYEVKEEKEETSLTLNESSTAASTSSHSIGTQKQKNLLREFLNSTDANKENNQLSKLFSNSSLNKSLNNKISNNDCSNSSRQFPLLDDVKNKAGGNQNKKQTPQQQPVPPRVEIRLRDFENLEKISRIELQAIELANLKKLYMLQPRNTRSLLYRMQKKQNSNFDGTSYTQTMQDLFSDCYQLPNLRKRYDEATNRVIMISRQPYDELFIWSLLIYGGNDIDLELCRHFWSKSKHPIACCLVAMIVYNNLISKNFIPEDLKSKMKIAVLEFEKMACGLLSYCSEANQLVAQDLLICELNIFYKSTVIELAIRAEALEFAGQSAVQLLLTDIWFDKLDPHVSYWQIILPYLFFPCIFLPISYFRSDVVEIINLTELDEKKQAKEQLKKKPNEATEEETNENEEHTEKKAAAAAAYDRKLSIFNFDQLGILVDNVPNTELSFRCTKKRIKGFNRVYSFYNAPIVKFINHFIFYILFLAFYCGFLLFDYYPDAESPTTVIRITIGTSVNLIKVTICELLIIIFVIIFQVDEIRAFIGKKTGDNNFKTKIKSFFTDNKWNIYDLFLFVEFYATLVIRFLPIYGSGVIYFGPVSCYEVARILYCFNLILWFVKILEAVSCLPFWGPKVIIIKAMVQKLLVYVVLILIFLIPFGTSVETILNKSQSFSLNVIINAFNRAYWTIFGELLGILEEFNTKRCLNNSKGNNTATECVHDFSSVSLYIGFGFYTITCNLLLLNMIIATFASTVENIDADSHKFYQFQRFEGVQEFSQKTLIPPPFVVFEFVLILAQRLWNYLNGTTDESKDNFHIFDMQNSVKKAYEAFEANFRDQFFYDHYIKPKQPEKSVDGKDLMESLGKLETNFSLYKIWTQEQQNEKFRLLKSLIEGISFKVDQALAQNQIKQNILSNFIDD